MGNLTARPDGAYGPSNSHAMLDCLAELVAAVLFSFTAVESFANHVIDMLPDNTLLASGKGELAKHDLVRSLGIDDKFKRAIPLLEEARAIAGDHDVWQRYQALKLLRDELVHVKSRGYDPDPTVLTAYARRRCRRLRRGRAHRHRRRIPRVHPAVGSTPVDRSTELNLGSSRWKTAMEEVASGSRSNCCLSVQRVLVKPPRRVVVVDVGGVRAGAQAYLGPRPGVGSRPAT